MNVQRPPRVVIVTGPPGSGKTSQQLGMHAGEFDRYACAAPNSNGEIFIVRDEVAEVAVGSYAVSGEPDSSGAESGPGRPRSAILPPDYQQRGARSPYTIRTCTDCGQN